MVTQSACEDDEMCTSMWGDRVHEVMLEVNGRLNKETMPTVMLFTLPYIYHPFINFTRCGSVDSVGV